MDRYVENIFSNIKDYEINMEDIELHPEEYGNQKINLAINNGIKDIKNIDNEIKTLGQNINLLLEKTVNRLDVVSDIINSEKERLQDIKMLCNSKTDYENVIPLSDTDFNGNFNYENEVFSVSTSQSKTVDIKVIDVAGNGYEGNKYVRRDKDYLEDILNTKNRNHITDNNISTYWEYSRITASNTEEYLLSDFNTDSSESKCTITLQFESASNELIIKSTLNNLKVTGIKYSNDNITYKDLDILPFTLNNREDSYKEQGYVYGSNVIAFPSSKYIKITFESIGYLNDTISFERVVTENNNNQTITTIVPTAKRHVIRINDIEAREKVFTGSSSIKTGELINNKTDIYAISVFANIYLPKGLTNDYVTFTLTVNGVDYNVLPVNSYDNGIKIIRFSQGKMPTEYTKYIGEKITSAYLTINMKSKNGKITPYINNLKILLGGEI